MAWSEVVVKAEKESYALTSFLLLDVLLSLVCRDGAENDIHLLERAALGLGNEPGGKCRH